jgi:cell division protein ZapA
MSANDPSPVSVQILDKEYLIACPADEQDDLLQSAAHLNARLREIRGAGKVVGMERIVVMAALNMANDLLKQRNRETRLETDVGTRVRHLRERVEKALSKGQQLEL